MKTKIQMFATAAILSITGFLSSPAACANSAYIVAEGNFPTTQNIEVSYVLCSKDETQICSNGSIPIVPHENARKISYGGEIYPGRSQVIDIKYMGKLYRPALPTTISPNNIIVL